MKINDLVPLEQYTWRENRNWERSAYPLCYCGFDLKEAILMYQEMLEALFLGKMQPEEDFGSKIAISYDYDILAPRLAEITYLAMEYDEPLLLKEAYCRLRDGNENLGDILAKLRHLENEDENKNAAAQAIRLKKDRMSNVLEKTVLKIAEGLGLRATQESYQDSLEKIFDSEKREAALREMWEEWYPDHELTGGDVDEMSRLMLLDSDLHEEILWTKAHLDGEKK